MSWLEKLDRLHVSIPYIGKGGVVPNWLIWVLLVSIPYIGKGACLRMMRTLIEDCGIVSISYIGKGEGNPVVEIYSAD